MSRSAALVTDVREQLLAVAGKARPWQTARDEKITDEALAVVSVRPFHLEGRL
ncbi:hypothetical protein ACH4UM_37575 [Streptomyces sp. NPDC020801]|uniref:hypothetical protein n=1 Tax=unclassified Streptomyces TaxID=2593676 RepID=UPI0037A46B31